MNIKYSVLIALLISPLMAKSPWTFKGKVGLEQNGNNVGLTGGLLAEYDISEFFQWRTDFDIGVPQIDKLDFFTIKIPSNLLWSPLGKKQKIRPYLGPGIGYQFNSENSHKLSLNGLGGVEFEVNKQVFGIEARYTLSEWNKVNTGKWEFALTGQWKMEF